MDRKFHLYPKFSSAKWNIPKELWPDHLFSLRIFFHMNYVNYNDYF